MLWQLRATAGPLEGAIYQLRKRTTLGRAGDCDIQIINDGVSRRHAKVVAAADGHELVDLGSNNGTFVGDQRTERHVLRSGDVIRIMRSCFVYEPCSVDDSASEGGEVWAVKVTSGVTLRQTVDHAVVAPPRIGIPPPGDTMDDLEIHRPRAALARVLEPTRRRIKALRPNGRPYEGDLVGDIMVFRDLQLRVTRRDSISKDELEVLQGFTKSFRQPSDDPSPYASLRRFVRFRCRVPARLRWLEGNAEQIAAVDLEDLSVGGARVTWHDHPLHEGVVTWLVIDTMIGARTRTLVFPTRVAWATPTEVGLQFAGMPEQEPEQG
ncbi:MAG: FHA domain-containing protein [Myxococcota bacterium]